MNGFKVLVNWNRMCFQKARAGSLPPSGWQSASVFSCTFADFGCGLKITQTQARLPVCWVKGSCLPVAAPRGRGHGFLPFLPLWQSRLSFSV